MTTFEKEAPSDAAQEENRRLRKIISDAAAALPNGAYIAPTCSVEFMAGLPNEISMVIAGLTASPSPEKHVEGSEPLFWYRPVGEDGGYEGPHHASAADGKMLRERMLGEWVPLFSEGQLRAERERCAEVAASAVMKFRRKVGGRYYPGYHENMRDAVREAVKNG